MQNFAIYSLLVPQESALADLRKKCKEKEVPHDVAEAEEMLKRHHDLLSEIEANREKYALNITFYFDQKFDMFLL